MTVELIVPKDDGIALSVSLPRWNRYLNRVMAAEISEVTRYYDRTIQWNPRETDTGYLLQSIKCPQKQIAKTLETFPDLIQEIFNRSAVLLNGNFNHEFDIQNLLREIKTKLARTSRVIVVAYNPYLSWLYRLANSLGLRKGTLPSTFITHTDLKKITELAGFQVVRIRNAGYFPWRLLGLGSLINSVLPTLPFFRWFCFASIVTLRPIIPSNPKELPSLSIVIPARNERGNIENALKRMPDLGTKIEIVFVEGHSKDQTWEEIERVIPLYSSRFEIKAYKQTGKGKSDAVRLGFSKATGDLITILDADLTMPPEMLGRFFDAYCSGLADFVNGTRLVYPMEGEAMRFLNRLGNVFFAKALSTVLESRLGDSLCGTKLLARHDYARMIAWRKDFGDFDPFGDFELLFPAATLALGTIDIPIRYLARTYGSTNISRFYHGFVLLKMTLIGLFRIRLGKTS